MERHDEGIPCAFLKMTRIGDIEMLNCSGTTVTPQHCGAQCPFYKTPEERKASLEKAHARMRTLPAELQRYYAAMYYNGAMPWMEDDDERTDEDNPAGLGPVDDRDAEKRRDLDA